MSQLKLQILSKKNYPVLNQKIDKHIWKRYLLLENIPEKNLYKTNEPSLKIISQANSKIFSETCNININEMGMINYLNDINMLLKNSTLSEEETSQIKRNKETIMQISYYVIGNNYFPQLVFNENTGRCFIYPTFNWKKRWIENLFFKYGFIELEETIPYDIDINGAVPRAFLEYIGKKEKKDVFYKYAYSENELYHNLYREIKGKELQEQDIAKFKRKFLSFLNDPNKDKTYLSDKNHKSNLLDYIDKYRILLGSKGISYVTNLFVLKLFNNFIQLNGGYENFRFLNMNYDGGIFMFKGKELKNDINYLKLKRFIVP